MARISTDSHAYNSSSNSVLNTFRASGMDETGDISNNLAITSTNISVESNNMRVGFIQSLSPSESRNIVKVQELGSEGVIQSVPSNTNGGQLSVSRFALYNGTLMNSLGLTRTGGFVPDPTSDGVVDTTTVNTSYSNPFKTLKDQRVPLEIKVKTRMASTTTDSGNSANTTVTAKLFTTTYVDCWLSSYTKTIAANTITITEQATIQYSDVMTAYA